MFETVRTTLALTPETATSTDPMQAAEARMRRALGLEGDQPRSRPPAERVEVGGRPMERFASPSHKRRFVTDGEVPVTLVHGLVSGRRDHADGNGTGAGANTQPTNRLEVAEAALAAEIATRERAERALQEAQATVHDLQTKLGHADLARQEFVETLRRERDATAGLRAAWQEAEDKATTARQAQEAAEAALAALQERQKAIPEVIEEAPPPRPRRGRKPRVETAAIAETLPVAAKPRKIGLRKRTPEAAPAREPKPIRWWLTPRSKKKR